MTANPKIAVFKGPTLQELQKLLKEPGCTGNSFGADFSGLMVAPRPGGGSGIDPVAFSAQILELRHVLSYDYIVKARLDIESLKSETVEFKYNIHQCMGGDFRIV